GRTKECLRIYSYGKLVLTSTRHAIRYPDTRASHPTLPALCIGLFHKTTSTGITAAK
ncbi:hypothetical protein L195_g063308, partial [Trifolium pratense]